MNGTSLALRRNEESTRRRRPSCMARLLAYSFGPLLLVVIASGGVRSEPATDIASPLGTLPPGWTFAVTDVIAVFSPGGETGNVSIIAPPVLATVGDVKTAFTEEVPTLIEDLIGEARPTGVPLPLPASDAVAPGLLVPLTVVTEDGSEARLEATGYPVPGKRMQLFFVAAPAGMPDDAPDLRAARTLVDQWSAAGLIVTPDLTSQAGGRETVAGSEDAGDAPAATPDAPPPAASEVEVENLIHFLRFAFDGSGGMSEPRAITALLLKDGRVFESEARAPAEFDPSSRPPGSAGTGRWQRDGEAYALAFADGTQGTAVAAAAKTLAAPAAMTFAGRYTAIGGPPSDLLTTTMEFFPDGSLLLKDDGKSSSGAYAIAERTIRVTAPGQAGTAFVFGYRGEADEPELLILGNRIYERSE
jgi:hypothetical protein